MHRRGRIIGAIVGCAVLFMVGTTVHSATRYTVQDLGSFRAHATNSHQDLVGQRDGEAIICLDGQPCLSLGPGTANDVNDARQVVGLVSEGGFLWTPEGELTMLPQLFDSDFTEPLGIGPDGTVVGRSWVCPVACGPPEAFVIPPTHDRVILLPGLQLQPFESTAWAVNVSGVIVGMSSASPWDDIHAMRCTREPLACEDLGVLEALGSSVAYAINTSGAIVGWAWHADGQVVAMHYTDATGMRPLAGLGGWTASWAFAINDTGAMVGATVIQVGRDDFQSEAVYWSAQGQPHIIGNLLQDTSGWQLTEAWAIHNDGRILATGVHQGQFKGVVLHPVPDDPEPIPPPVADLSVEPLSGEAPLTVTATSLSSGAIDSTTWDFGEGTTSTEATATHTYTAPDTYTVTLTVEGPGGSDQASVQVTVTAPPPPDPGPEPIPPPVASIVECVQAGLRGQALASCIRNVLSGRAVGSAVVSRHHD